jgi:beta-galactosidase
MHSRSEASYDLTGSFTRFVCWVGVDPVSGREGQVNVEVLADERLVWRRHGLRAADGGLFVEADVRGASRLKLRADYGRGGDIGDDVNWGDPRLVK